MSRALAAILVFFIAPALAAGDPAADALRGRWTAFDENRVADSAGRPVQVQSRDDGTRAMGEIYGVIPVAFDTAAAALKDPRNWCEILLLHLDTKDCQVHRDGARTTVQAGVVTHYDQPASTAYRVEFAYALAADTPDYVAARLDAEDGPVDTRDFRILFEALRTPDGMMFAHMSYAYAYGGMSRLALRLYLLTFGHGKVGFSVVGQDEQGHPRYVGGMRGVVERNTMRYYLAVEAWLGALAAPAGPRIDRAMRNWYAAAERYPRQLHELSEDDYLSRKRRDLASVQRPPM